MHRLCLEITLTTPTPHLCQKNMPPKYAIQWGSVWHKSRLKSRDFHRKYVGPATTQNLVVKFDGEICGGVLVENASDDFPSKRSSKISFQTSPEVRHQFRRKLHQLHSGNRWWLKYGIQTQKYGIRPPPLLCHMNRLYWEWGWSSLLLIAAPEGFHLPAPIIIKTPPALHLLGYASLSPPLLLSVLPSRIFLSQAGILYS